MDAIKKKMQAMKGEKENAVERATEAEEQAKEANVKAEKVSQLKERGMRQPDSVSRVSRVTTGCLSPGGRGGARPSEEDPTGGERVGSSAGELRQRKLQTRREGQGSANRKHLLPALALLFCPSYAPLIVRAHNELKQTQTKKTGRRKNERKDALFPTGDLTNSQVESVGSHGAHQATREKMCSVCGDKLWHKFFFLRPTPSLPLVLLVPRLIRFIMRIKSAEKCFSRGQSADVRYGGEE